jgi:hypothetical protein
MPKPPFSFAFLVCTALLTQAASSNAFAQQDFAAKPLMLVTWFGPGGIPLPTGEEWKPELLTVYDKGARPVAQFSNAASKLSVSFIVFENLSGNPTAQGCRGDAIDPIVKNEGKLISKRVDGEFKNASGEMLATTSYLLDMGQAGGPHQLNLFGFAGNAKTCAEIHISSVINTADEEEAMKANLAAFKPDLNYQSDAGNYFRLASVLFKGAPGLAAPYYKSALDALPDNPKSLTPRRIIIDQLIMSLGMSGDLKNSRAVAANAITKDPDYPLNYYNLACADAEEGKAADAKIHLQQAFDRRANVISGEKLPDPSKDDSILKLKSDRTFWAFVMSLPKD